MSNKNLEKKDWVKVIDDAREAYNSNSQIKFMKRILDSSLCSYNDAYILVKWTRTVVRHRAYDGAITADRKNKQASLKTMRQQKKYCPGR